MPLRQCCSAPIYLIAFAPFRSTRRLSSGYLTSSQHTLYPLSSAPCVRAETSRETLEKTFEAFTARPDVGLVIINQPVADSIRPVIAKHKAIIPMVLEIPSKDVAYDPAKDPIMKRVLSMLGEI